MPANPPKDAIVIALDVGKSVSTLHDNENKSFFNKARDCVSWIIQRKIISQSVDVLSIVLIGSHESNSSYENINLQFDFQQASWDMLNFIMKDVKSTNIESDWFKGLIYSVEILKIHEEYDNIRSKKIVIFSNFTYTTSDDFDVIIKNLEEANIEVTIIGPDHLHSEVESGDEEPENKRKRLDIQDGEKVVYDLWKRLPENITICTFESALKQLCSYTPKTKRINYWNCMMDIGEVYINISMLKKTDPKPSKKFNTKYIKLGEGEPSQGTSSQNLAHKSVQLAATIKDTVMHYKHGFGEKDYEDVEVTPEDTIEGFRYGTNIIPFSEEDKKAMEYKPGPKSFSVLGFTRTSNVPYYLLSGECSYLVLPRINDKDAEVALSAIIQGMKKLECLAIVKRVYSDNRGLSLGILYPITEEIFSDETDDVSHREYLLYVELAFQDDVKTIDFPTLEFFAKEITDKQYNAIDDLIDGMDLMKADKCWENESQKIEVQVPYESIKDKFWFKDILYLANVVLARHSWEPLVLNIIWGLRGEPCEAFDLPYLHDVKEQFFQYCVIQRGLCPDKPLPVTIPPYIKNYTEVPQKIAQNCKSAIKNIKREFKIKKLEIENEDSNQKKKNWQPLRLVEHFSERVIEGEKDQMTRTWMRLFQKSFPSIKELEELFIKLNAEDAETSNVVRSFGLVITQIRAMYSNHRTNPESFNKWMVEFKNYLDGNSGIFSKLWEIIEIEFVGLIPKEENRNSKTTEEEAFEFLSKDIDKSRASNGEKPDFELLDELQAEQMNLDPSVF